MDEQTMAEKEFFDSIPNPHTKKEYRNGLQRFSAWFGHNPDEILQMRKDDLKSAETFQRKRFERELEKFHAYLKDQGLSTNSARSLCMGLRQFFRYYEVPITLRRGSEVGKAVLTDKTYPLTIEEIRKMFAVADLKQRVILSMAKDLGLRIKDFLSVKKDDLPDLNLEPPIPFDITTGKEEVLAKGHLSAETVELLKFYLPTIKEKTNPYLFPSNGKNPINVDTVGWNLKELARKAGIVVPKGKRLTFHAFRKLFISTGKNLNIDSDIVKALCGKSVDASILTYMTTVQWREAFSKIAETLKIQQITNKNHARLEELEERNKKLAEQVATLLYAVGQLAGETKKKQIEELIKRQKAKFKKDFQPSEDA
jgi:integrase